MSVQNYEAKACYRDDLSFIETERYFKKHGRYFSKKSSELLNADGFFTNLALALSDQNNASTYLKFYQGQSTQILLDTKILTGSILRQFEEAYFVFHLANQKRVLFPHTNKQTVLDSYPPQALNLALSVAHVLKDASNTRPVQVEFYKNRVQISFPIVKSDANHGLEIKMQNLNNILGALGYPQVGESWLALLEEAYGDVAHSPVVDKLSRMMVITLPNRMQEEAYVEREITRIEKADTASYELWPDLEPATHKDREDDELDSSEDPFDEPEPIFIRDTAHRRSLILDLLRNDPERSVFHVSQILKVSEATVQRDIKYLRDLGHLRYVGHGAHGIWEVLI